MTTAHAEKTDVVNPDDHTLKELTDIAKDEGVEIHGDSTKAEIAKAINKHRKNNPESSDKHTGNPETPGNPKARQAPGQEVPEAIKSQQERYEQSGHFGPEPLPADHPARAPRPENVDAVKEGERLTEADREFGRTQGDKAPRETHSGSRHGGG
jgi:hypothetical protein